jgi:hypothetical protein
MFLALKATYRLTSRCELFIFMVIELPDTPGTYPGALGHNLKPTKTLRGDTMRCLRTVIPVALVALLLMGGTLHAEGPYLLVRVNATPEVKLLPLLELGLDIAAGVKEQYLDIVCFPEDLATIRALGYTTEVLIPDMERFYRERALAEGLASDDMGGYHTWDECEAHIDSIHALYPTITSAPFSIGNTIQGRPMRVIKVSDNPDVDEDEAEIFFNGMIHAREPIGMEICLELLDELTGRYGIDPDITARVNTREIYIMPVFNVDGYVYNQQQSPGGGGMWRKNRRLNSGGSYGVDLNRNFGFNWGYNNIGSSSSQSSETYRGTGPFSEPETENVRQFCNSRYFGIGLNFHSYGDLMIYSWSIPPPAWGYTPDDPTFVALSQTMQSWNGYTYGTAWDILYEVNGDANDWMYGEQGEKPKTLAWVHEVGGSFWPAASLIQGLINENIPSCYFLIDEVENYQPMPVALAYAGGVIDDASGNNNGGLDPGESVLFTPDLRNNGWVTGTNISATLWEADAYVTITTASSTYPNLAAHAQAPSNTPYALSVSSSCPVEHEVRFGLIWTCAEGFSDTAFFDLLVGDPLYQPMGPDGYGYYAYDQFDENGPAYNWIEVDPTVGGFGTLITYTVDDQTVPLSLPFTFQYYGQDYTQISVCNNGWVAMGLTTETDHSNSAIPNPDGPPAMIAPFWEDLSPQQLGRVAYYYNSADHYYVVEFDSVRQYSPTTARETFEVVLYDPAYYPTQTGDGQILFQFKGVMDPSSATVGIENPAETIGLQVWYNGAWDAHMAPLQNETAYLFSTPTSAASATIIMTPYGTPILVPAIGGSFDYNIAVANTGSSPLTGDVWVDVTLPSGSTYGPALGPVVINMPVGFNQNRDRTQTVPGGAPAGTYSYNGHVGDYPNVDWDSDSFTFEKLATGDGSPVSEWLNWGEEFETAEADAAPLPDRVSLSPNYPNPFNPITNITYGLPEGSFVSLKVYDLLGREVAILIDGYRSAGVHQTAWDASRLASGIYLYVLRAGGYTAANKCLLMK